MSDEIDSSEQPYPVPRMDAASAQIFHVLEDEFLQLFLRWRLYRSLYADAPSAIGTWQLSESSPFTVLKTVLFEDVIVRLCKLTESTKPFGNLSIHALAESLESAEPGFVTEVFSKKMQDLIGKCAKLREVRNKRIAHVDCAHAFSEDRDSLPSITFEDVKAPIHMLAAALNAAAMHYGRVKIWYDAIVVPVSADLEELQALLRRNS